MSLAVVFDADNTLWDTDSVFRGAQLDLLRVFAQAGLIREENAEFETLRAVDQELGMRFQVSAFSEWWQRIAKAYNVRANLHLNGNE